MIGIGALVGAIVILLLAVNLYVQSQATQARIQQELSQRLNAPLRIRTISVTPWGGLKLTGITIPQTQPGVVGDFLEAQTFRLRIRFGSLFAQRLVIKEVSLIGPNVTWIQNADGKWRLPESPRPAEVPAEVHEKPVATAPAPGAVPTTAPSQVAITKKSPPPHLRSEPAPFAPEVRRVRLARGEFNFLDGKGKVVARFNGVNFRSAFRNTTALNGTIDIAKTSLRDRFFLEKLNSPMRYDPNIMEFSNVSAQADGGKITGGFSMRPQEKDSPFTAQVRFHDLQADRIITEAGGPKGMVKGRLEGSLDAAGKTADQNALNGYGEIFLRDGEVQQYSLLVALGQILQIEELTQLRLEQAEVKYRLTPGLITVDQLLVHSPNIRLTATGTITFAGKLKLESQLAINEKIRSQLFRAIRDNFQPTSDPAYSAIAFQITGSADRPKTNLVDKMIGGELKDFGSVLNSLFGGKSDRPKKKKKDETAQPAELTSPSPTPSATP